MKAARALTLLVTVLVGALVGSLLGAAPASAAPPQLTVSAPASAYAGTTATIRGTTSRLDGEILLERGRNDGAWERLAATRPASDGSYAVGVSVVPGAQRLRVRHVTVEGTAVRELGLTGTAAPSRLALSGPARLTDGRTATLTARWTTGDGRAVTGTAALWGRRSGESAWTRRGSVAVRAGSGKVRVKPRVDVAYQLRTARTAYVLAGTSAPRVVDNVPPGRVFVRPPGAASPRIRLPRQPRARKAGAHVSVSRISNAVWRSMKGRTWHRGCPVGRSSLRILRTNYYAYDGYRRRGEIVVHARVAKATKRVFRDLHAAKAPIRSLYRVDRFGWSRRLRGGDDMKSMAAGNSSGFNCRSVVGRPGRRSPHSTGRSIDLNTWENPYRSAWGLVPNRDWDSRRSPAAFVYRSRNHAVVRILARHGFRWLGSADWQHFQYSGRGARHLPAPKTFWD
ncbi:M15 family metallopeptidase [Mumia sp. zg.B53]|uniref:M15 family metallopeptidase n=1 Tax=unclassified Mumia TaxID=2621872 RepID=UPI001C6EEAB7|nr:MULTISPECIES: M15 family metallopeptidase [unclassified Mumia]MBW9211599.1 M15 family metallopeptidase [Mumia sp. zg.B21]MBW9216770.1 M15 family metallopeptidase [Mumia sp. zg.B53]